MRSTGLGFENDTERNPPRSTHGAKVKEDEATCIDKPLKKTQRLPDTLSNTFIFRCGLISCLFFAFLIGMGAGIGIGWGIKDSVKETDTEQCVETTEVITTRTFKPCNCTLTEQPSPPPPMPICPSQCDYTFTNRTYYTTSDHIRACSSSEDAQCICQEQHCRPLTACHADTNCSSDETCGNHDYPNVCVSEH